MAWISAGVETKYNNTDTNSAQYGTRTPNLSAGFNSAVADYKAALNPNGLNSTQQTGQNMLTGLAANPTYRTATGTTNDTLTGQAAKYDPFTTQKANLSAGAPTIAAKTGADYMDLYKDPYQKDVVDSSLADYDAGVNKQYGAFRAGTAGAFGNRRTGLAESSFADAAARGRGSLSANLLSSGFNTRAGLGQQDASRALSADTSNAGNLLSNNQFNANAETQNRTQQLTAIAGQTGIAQQKLDNIVKSDGIDMELAQSLYAAGSITQAQLDQLAQYASAGNGSSYTDNKNTNTNEFGVDAKAGFGI